MNYIPDFAFGTAGNGAYQSTQIPIGEKLSRSFSAGAQVVNTEGEISGIGGGLALTGGGWDRRTAEWQLQVETAALYRRMYDLAGHSALQAQRAYNYERGYTVRRFLPEAGWDDLHEGLTAADRLHVALRHMESAYRDSDCREYELTKHLSLLLDFPHAFLRLRETGAAEIEIPEWMFDLDYPGQYLRRIRNVTVTLPCIVGPYTGVHCKLTLLGSTTRVDPRLAPPPAGCCDDRDRRDDRRGDRDRCGECDECDHRGRDEANGYSALLDDPRLVRAYTATEAIARSSGQSDSGLFELSFHDERYLPFEYAGR